MENAPSKILSSLIKNSGAEFAPSRGAEIAPRAREIAAVNGWVKTPAWIVTDSRLSPTDRIVWQVVALIEFHYGRCEESQDVIAAVASVARRQVLRSIAKLIELGLMTRQRAPRKSIPDRLGIIIVAESPRGLRAAAATSCSQCHADRQVDRVGICVVCRKNAEAQREVDEFISRHGPAPLEIVWLGLKGNGSRSSQKAIQRAYLTAKKRIC